jgi:hypothetical protein
MPTIIGPVVRPHLLIEEPWRQGRGFPQCAVRRGLDLGREAVGLASTSFDGLPMRPRRVFQVTYLTEVRHKVLFTIAFGTCPKKKQLLA